MTSRTKNCLTLMGTFMKIGLFTFGGGYAMIPLIHREVVEHYGWISDEEMTDMIAIAESTPGPIAVNSATFVGSHLAGVPGAACATFGVVLPSFVIIYILSHILEAFQSALWVQYAFVGIRSAVLALILKAMFGMFKKTPKDVLSYVLMGGALIATAFLNVSALLVIAASAVIGLCSALLLKRRDA